MNWWWETTLQPQGGTCIIGGDYDYTEMLTQIGAAGMGIAESLYYADNLW